MFQRKSRHRGTTSNVAAVRIGVWFLSLGLVASACGTNSEASQPEISQPSVSQPSVSQPSVSQSDTSQPGIARHLALQPGDEGYFATLPPGSELPDGDRCAEQVRAVSSFEVRPENEPQNSTVVDAGPIRIDGADEFWNEKLAPRIDGNFTGTTEQLLRWAACKWGFDENVTRARAVTESTWYVSTEGDATDSATECALIGLEAPCPQSYGLLQVKGTVHEGTYPFSTQSTALGLDYAMAWLRACYEGSFTWLIDEDYQDENSYAAGNQFGCVGTWFSGQWWGQPANDYVGEVRYHIQNETWLSF